MFDLLAEKIQLAEKLADVSGEAICRHFRQSHLPAETKVGEISSLVTLADRQAEEAMVELILKEAPGEGIIREEGADIPSENGRAWVLDPLDGTAAFVRGFPLFGTLIALVDLEQNIPLIGLANQPILQERWVGIRGQTTRFNKRPLFNPYAKEKRGKLAEACLSSTTPFMFVTEEQQRKAKKLQKICQRQAFGGDCYNYLMLASGWNSLPAIVLEADLKYYDFCALIPIIEGTGSAIADWSGNSLSPQSTEVLAASNPFLLEQALAIIN